MEKKLPEHAQKLFETMPLGFVFHSKDGAISYANHATTELLGLSNDQLLGKISLDKAWHAIHPNGEDFPGVTHPAVPSLKQGITIKKVVMDVFHSQENNYKSLLINAVPKYLTNESKPYQAFVTFNDLIFGFDRNEILKHIQNSTKELNGINRDINGILTANNINN